MRLLINKNFSIEFLITFLYFSHVIDICVINDSCLVEIDAFNKIMTSFCKILMNIFIIVYSNQYYSQ